MRQQHIGLAAALVALVLFGGTARAAEGAAYPTPDAAVSALVAAVKGGGKETLKHVLGPGSGKLVDSGDPVADRKDRADFLKSYDEHHAIEVTGDTAALQLGADNWTMPITLKKAGDAWHFDAQDARQAILDRRIGRNELDAIEICRAIVDAERDYVSVTGTGVFAEHFVSSPGKRDGLYWPVGSDGRQSPLGPLVEDARGEGYGHHHEPYHGYFYKIILRQGPHAPGGARRYVVHGRMIGGFAVVAYPAKWSDSGIMTFIVDQDGVVHQKNLGHDTVRIASAMTSYDPDASWSEVAAKTN